jgi:phosphoketolase
VTKQLHLQLMDMDSANWNIVPKGIGIWDWASTDQRALEPMVMAMQAIPQLRSVGCNCIV